MTARAVVVTLLALGGVAHAQELVTVQARPRATQSFFIADMAGRKPQAIALLYVGGSGNVNLRIEDGEPRLGRRNFLPRSEAHFVRNAVLPVVMGAPSDYVDLPDHYRMGKDQAADARAVIGELKKRYPGVPVFIAGTSRGTLSAAHLGRSLAGEIDGVVLTSTLFTSRARSQSASLRDFDYGSIKAPLLFVHHRDDGCDATPYAAAARLGERYPLVSVKGGLSAQSVPCEPFSAHGFFGKEAETVAAIANWMLKKPFAREIE